MSWATPGPPQASDAYRVQRLRANILAEAVADAGIQIEGNILMKDGITRTDQIGSASWEIPINVAGTMVQGGHVKYTALALSASLAAPPSAATSGGIIWQADGTAPYTDGTVYTTINDGATTHHFSMMPFTRTYQATYTTITDINYLTTTNVAVTGVEITLPIGTYLMGYGLTFLTSAESTIAAVGLVVADPAGTPADVVGSEKEAAYATPGGRCSVSHFFKLDVSAATTYGLFFKRGAGAVGVGVAIDMSVTGGLADPDNVPTLWAVQIA